MPPACQWWFELPSFCLAFFFFVVVFFISFLFCVFLTYDLLCQNMLSLSPILPSFALSLSLSLSTLFTSNLHSSFICRLVRTHSLILLLAGLDQTWLTLTSIPTFRARHCRLVSIRFVLFLAVVIVLQCRAFRQMGIFLSPTVQKN